MSSSLPLIPMGPEAPGSDGRSPSHQNPRRSYGRAPEPETFALNPDPGQRLVIQEDGTTGKYLYTVIDRASGQVVAQTSREEVARMGQRAGYAAGSLIRAKA